jgi:hypothetical protein
VNGRNCSLSVGVEGLGLRILPDDPGSASWGPAFLNSSFWTFERAVLKFTGEIDVYGPSMEEIVM